MAVPLTIGNSDGNPSHTPGTYVSDNLRFNQVPFHQSDSLKKEIEEEVARVRGAPSFTFNLTALPYGYTHWQRSRRIGRRPGHVDHYVCGHPSGQPFKSFISFAKHAAWLANRGGNPGLTCECELCLGPRRRRQPAAPTLASAPASAPAPAPSYHHHHLFLPPPPLPAAAPPPAATTPQDLNSFLPTLPQPQNPQPSNPPSTHSQALNMSNQNAESSAPQRQILELTNATISNGDIVQVDDIIRVSGGVSSSGAEEDRYMVVERMQRHTITSSSEPDKTYFLGRLFSRRPSPLFPVDGTAEKRLLRIHDGNWFGVLLEKDEELYYTQQRRVELSIVLERMADV